MTSQSKVAKERGFRFFFWLSASLFILAGVNWLFDNFIGISNLIGISGPASYLLSITILILAIVLSGSLLSMAYHAIPQIREILDGLLGLQKCICPEATPAAESKTISRDGKKFDKENKDIELKKLDLAVEEHRRRFYTALGGYFSVLVAVAIAILSFTLSLTTYTVTTFNGTASTTIPTPSVLSFILLAVYGIVGLGVSTVAFGAIREYKGQLPRLNELIEDIENYRSIGTVEEILRRIRGRD